MTRDPWFTLFSRKVGLPAPVVPKVECRRKIRIPLADGVHTLADHWTPVGVSDAPLVLIRSPYGRKIFNLLGGRFLAHQGFQVIVQSSRGTEGSEGSFDDPFACEVEDGAATVAWLRQQSWYPGRFFTFGDSYLGWNQLALMPAAGDELAGAVLRVAPSSVYDMFWPGGVLNLKAGLTWSVMAERNPVLGLGNMIREKRNAPKLAATVLKAPLMTSYRDMSMGTIGFWEQWLGHPSKDDNHWDSTELLHVLDDVRCPVLVQGGWYDLFLEDSLSQYARLAAHGAPVELNLGPWTHADMLTKGMATSFTDATAFLRDIAGLEARPATTKPVRLIEINSRASVALDGWPVPSGGELTYQLAAGRLTEAGDQGSTSYRYDPADPTPSVGGASNDDVSGSKDNTELEQRADVITFTSDPLPAATHLLGSPSVALTFASDRADTCVFVRLCEVTASGQSFNHTDRLVLLHSRDRAADGTWSLDVTLPPTCLEIPAGHRIRLQVSSGAFPRLMRHPGTAESAALATEFHPASQTVQHAGASLRLPLRVEVSDARLSSAAAARA